MYTLKFIYEDIPLFSIVCVDFLRHTIQGYQC